MLPTRFAAGLLALSLSVSIAQAQGMPSFGGGMSSGPTEVGVMTLQQATVPYSVTLPGRAVAFASTDIRPRVTGMIEEIVYTPGAMVQAGDVLFRLESATYETALASAEAAKASAEAAVAAAQNTVDRYAKLEGIGVTAVDVETSKTDLMSAQATLRSAEAALQSAQLDLDRTEIRSPINGIVDVADVSVGTIVTANQTDALTTVTQLDPIYVDVAESSARISRVREQFDSGALTAGKEISASLSLESGNIYEGMGTLVSPGLSVSTTTGAVDFRFSFANPDRMILPGQFLRVGIEIGSREAILVPQRATTRQSDGSLTVYLAQEGKAEQVTLTTAGTYQNAWIVTAGVEAGQEVILDGLTNLSDGAEITTVPVTIDAAGVVQDATE